MGFKGIDDQSLHPFGETVYNIFGSKLAIPIHKLDNMLNKTFGIFAQKSAIWRNLQKYRCDYYWWNINGEGWFIGLRG